jgi:hypothetical protein
VTAVVEAVMAESAVTEIKEATAKVLKTVAPDPRGKIEMVANAVTETEAGVVKIVAPAQRVKVVRTATAATAKEAIVKVVTAMKTAAQDPTVVLDPKAKSEKVANAVTETEAGVVRTAAPAQSIKVAITAIETTAKGATAMRTAAQDPIAVLVQKAINQTANPESSKRLTRGIQVLPKHKKAAPIMFRAAFLFHSLLFR